MVVGLVGPGGVFSHVDLAGVDGQGAVDDAGITRQEVRTLGFDLLDQQVDSLTEHYLRYPTFVQAVR